MIKRMLRRAYALACCYGDIISFNKVDCDSIVDFCFSQPIAPLQIKYEFSSLLKEVANRRPRTVLELGTAAGGSLFSLCRCSAPDAVIISLDLPGGKYGGGYHWAKIPLYREFAVNQQKLHLIRGNSHSRESLARVERILGDRKLDLLFIDGDHSYEGVRMDFEQYSPLVAKGGLIVLHDIVKHRPELECDVDRFWEDIKHRYSHRELIQDRSQGWAGVGLIYL